MLIYWEIGSTILDELDNQIRWVLPSDFPIPNVLLYLSFPVERLEIILFFSA
jgi:hypothetical protein